jgi:coatomer subunit beta'
LTGHKASVNTIDFFKGDKPHLVTGSDDHAIKVWDYQTRQCLQTLEAYKMAITSVFYHPDLPLLISTG